MKAKKYKLAFFIVGILILGGLIITGCKETGKPDTTLPNLNVESKATYVGTKACSSCHAQQGKDFATTSHAHAFKSLSEYSLDKEYTVKLFDTANAEKVVSADVTLSPETTLGVMMDHYIVAKAPEGFKSEYYRVGALHESGNGKYSIEPASKGDYDKDGKGEDWGAADYTCGSCHSPGVAAGSDDLGVSCESCHGPGSKHVEAENKKGSYPINVSTCLKCHPLQPAKDAKTGAITAQNHYGTRGFYATKHYTSQQLNSCLTCHNAHKANASGKMILKDNTADLCNTCHAEHKFDANSVANTFWKNPVDARSHFTADHSFYQIKLSDYKIDETAKTMTLSDNMVSQVRSLFPDLFK